MHCPTQGTLPSRIQVSWDAAPGRALGGCGCGVGVVRGAVTIWQPHRMVQTRRRGACAAVPFTPRPCAALLLAWAWLACVLLLRYPPDRALRQGGAAHAARPDALNMADDTPARVKLSAIERLAAVKQPGQRSGLRQAEAHRWCCDRSGGCARPAFLEKPPHPREHYAVTASGPAALMPDLNEAAYDETMIQQGLCLCEVGYAGQSCEPTCVPPCQHGGRCVAPGDCECSGPYAGALCEEHVCTPPCAAHGVCAASNRCTCARGYQGDRCSLKCVHGVAYFGTCQCVPGWVGRACDRALCRQTCVHGSCVEPNRCACDDGWAGFDCTAATTAAARGQRNTGRLGAAGAAAADELPLTAPNAELLLRSKEEVASLQGDINRIKQRKAWQELEALEAELVKLQKLQRSVPSADTGRVTRGATGGGGGGGGEMRDARSTSRTRDDGRHSSERRPTKESLEAELAKYQAQLERLRQQGAAANRNDNSDDEP